MKFKASNVFIKDLLIFVKVQADNEKPLKFFCPTHGVEIKSVSQPHIYCRSGDHNLAVEFPSGGDWVYCFECQRFYPRTDLGKNGLIEICVSCEKHIQRRFLCPECLTLFVESGKTQEKKEYFINVEDNAIPPCRACRKMNSGLSVHLHNCPIIKAEFYIAQTDCPFCKTSIFGEEFINLKKNLEQLSNNVWSLNNRLVKIEREKAETEPANTKSNPTSNTDKNIFILRQLLDEFEKKTQSVFAELSKLKDKVAWLEEKAVLNETFIKHKEEIRQYLESQYPPIDKPVSKYGFPAKIGNIISQAQDKIWVVPYPLLPKALKIRTNNSELAPFCLIEEIIGGEVRHYAVPAFPRIAREVDFKLYNEFYQTESRIFMGEFEVIDPAQVRWDKDIRAWQLIKMGKLRII